MELKQHIAYFLYIIQFLFKFCFNYWIQLKQYSFYQRIFNFLDKLFIYRLTYYNYNQSINKNCTVFQHQDSSTLKMAKNKYKNNNKNSSKKKQHKQKQIQMQKEEERCQSVQSQVKVTEYSNLEKIQIEQENQIKYENQTQQDQKLENQSLQGQNQNILNQIKIEQKNQIKVEIVKQQQQSYQVSQMQKEKSSSKYTENNQNQNEKELKKDDVQQQNIQSKIQKVDLKAQVHQKQQKQQKQDLNCHDDKIEANSIQNEIVLTQKRQQAKKQQLDQKKQQRQKKQQQGQKEQEAQQKLKEQQPHSQNINQQQMQKKKRKTHQQNKNILISQQNKQRQNINQQSKVQIDCENLYDDSFVEYDQQLKTIKSQQIQLQDQHLRNISSFKDQIVHVQQKQQIEFYPELINQSKKEDDPKDKELVEQVGKVQKNNIQQKQHQIQIINQSKQKYKNKQQQKLKHEKQVQIELTEQKQQKFQQNKQEATIQINNQQEIYISELTQNKNQNVQIFIQPERYEYMTDSLAACKQIKKTSYKYSNDQQQHNNDQYQHNNDQYQHNNDQYQQNQKQFFMFQSQQGKQTEQYFQLPQKHQNIQKNKKLFTQQENQKQDDHQKQKHQQNKKKSQPQQIQQKLYLEKQNKSQRFQTNQPQKVYQNTQSSINQCKLLPQNKSCSIKQEVQKQLFKQEELTPCGQNQAQNQTPQQKNQIIVPDQPVDVDQFNQYNNNQADHIHVPENNYNIQVQEQQLITSHNQQQNKEECESQWSDMKTSKGMYYQQSQIKDQEQTQEKELIQQKNSKLQKQQQTNADKKIDKIQNLQKASVDVKVQQNNISFQQRTNKEQHQQELKQIQQKDVQKLQINDKESQFQQKMAIIIQNQRKIQVQIQIQQQNSIQPDDSGQHHDHVHYFQSQNTNNLIEGTIKQQQKKVSLNSQSQLMKSPIFKAQQLNGQQTKQTTYLKAPLLFSPNTKSVKATQINEQTNLKLLNIQFNKKVDYIQANSSSPIINDFLEREQQKQQIELLSKEEYEENNIIQSAQIVYKYNQTNHLSNALDRRGSNQLKLIENQNQNQSQKSIQLQLNNSRLTNKPDLQLSQQAIRPISAPSKQKKSNQSQNVPNILLQQNNFFVIQNNNGSSPIHQRQIQKQSKQQQILRIQNEQYNQLSTNSNHHRIVLTANQIQPIIVPRKIPSIQINESIETHLYSKVSQKSIDSPINKVYSSKSISESLRQSMEIPQFKERQVIRSSLPLSHQDTIQHKKEQPFEYNLSKNIPNDDFKHQQRKNFFQKYSKTVEEVDQNQKDSEDCENLKSQSNSNYNSQKFVMKTHMRTDNNYDFVPQNTPIEGVSPTFGPKIIDRNYQRDQSNQLQNKPNDIRYLNNASHNISAEQISNQLNKIVAHPIHHLHSKPAVDSFPEVCRDTKQISLDVQENLTNKSLDNSQKNNNNSQAEIIDSSKQIKNIHEKYRFFYNDNSVNQKINRMDKEISKYDPQSFKQPKSFLQNTFTPPIYVSNKTTYPEYMQKPQQEFKYSGENRPVGQFENIKTKVQNKPPYITFNNNLKVQEEIYKKEKPKSPEKAYYKFLQQRQNQDNNPRFPSQNWQTILSDYNNNQKSANITNTNNFDIKNGLSNSNYTNYYNQTRQMVNKNQNKNYQDFTVPHVKQMINSNLKITFNQNQNNKNSNQYSSYSNISPLHTIKQTGESQQFRNNQENRIKNQKIQIKLTPTRYQKSNLKETPIQKLLSQQQKEKSSNKFLNDLKNDQIKVNNFTIEEPFKTKQYNTKEKNIQISYQHAPYLIKNNDAPFLYTNNNNLQSFQKYESPQKQFGIINQYEYKIKSQQKKQPKSYAQLKGKLNKYLYKQRTNQQKQFNVINHNLTQNYIDSRKANIYEDQVNGNDTNSRSPQKNYSKRKKIILTIRDKQKYKIWQNMNSNEKQSQKRENKEDSLKKHKQHEHFQSLEKQKNLIKNTRIIRMNNNTNQRDNNIKSSSNKKIKLQLCKREKYEQKKFKEIPFFQNPNKIDKKQSPLKHRTENSPIQQEEVEFSQQRWHRQKRVQNYLKNHNHSNNKGLNLTNKDIMISPEGQKKSNKNQYSHERTPKIVNKILRLGERQKQFNENFSQIQNEEMYFTSN